MAKFLLEKGYEVYGAYRRLSTPNFWRLLYLGILDEVKLIPIELTDSYSVLQAVETTEPDETYHLAAQSFVGISFDQALSTGEVTGLGVTRILEAIRHVNPKIKFYQASTSELYGDGGYTLQNEDTPFRPWSPYAAAKLYGHWITQIYRDAYGIFACNGILFNHESPLRGLEFVTRKISNSVAKIALGLEQELHLGNLDAKRDWGYAPEYVAAMWLMLQQDKPDDYVIATGETHSVREFAERAFRIVGLDWQDHVKTDRGLMRPLDIAALCGDYSKAKQTLGWKPSTGFEKLVDIMVSEDSTRWKCWVEGKPLPWDVASSSDLPR